MEKDWKLIFSTDEPYQAELIKQMLENNKINAVVMNKQDSSYQTFGITEVYVNLNDESKALQLIKNTDIE
ncbi:DUF2007 domain-containing protein [Bacteroidota bacterium]